VIKELASPSGVAADGYGYGELKIVLPRPSDLHLRDFIA
jgi:hypothetical protein